MLAVVIDSFANSRAASSEFSPHRRCCVLLVPMQFWGLSLVWTAIAAVVAGKLHHHPCANLGTDSFIVERAHLEGKSASQYFIDDGISVRITSLDARIALTTLAPAARQAVGRVDGGNGDDRDRALNWRRAAVRLDHHTHDDCAGRRAEARPTRQRPVSWADARGQLWRFI